MFLQVFPDTLTKGTEANIRGVFLKDKGVFWKSREDP